MSLISSKIFAVSSAIAFGAPESPFTAYNAQVFAGAGSFVLPAGDWWIVENAAISVQINPSGDGTTWVTTSTASQGAFVRADGYTVRITASGATTANYYGPA